MKGRVKFTFKDVGGRVIREEEFDNLYVDDGKEYTLDFMFGIHDWHKYNSGGVYDTGLGGLWSQDRYVGAGTCMFNNASQERANGIDGIPSGQESNYPIATTYLVSPEDSFLSRGTGSFIKVIATRRDQTVELAGTFNVPGDIPTGVNLREFGIFLGSQQPANDPSYADASKPSAMLCRVVRYGTGTIGGTGVYSDDPFLTSGDVEFRWKFGEL